MPEYIVDIAEIIRSGGKVDARIIPKINGDINGELTIRLALTYKGNVYYRNADVTENINNIIFTLNSKD